MLVRPRRTATIRTRLDGPAVMERLSALVAAPVPEGMSRLMAKGYFLGGGSVATSDFNVEYHFNNLKNAQTYTVDGVLEETPEWRVLRLTLTARDPWIAWWMLVLIALVSAVATLGGARTGAGVMLFLFVVAVVAVANLFYIPDVVADRVSRQVASAVRGSILRNGQWMVPPD